VVTGRADLAAVVAGLLDIGPFARRVVQDCLQNADAQYWGRRARAFEAARHGGYVYPNAVKRHKKKCDYFLNPASLLKCDCPIIHHKGEPKVDSLGQAAPDELQARSDELTAVAKACHSRATLAGIDAVEVAALMNEAA